MIVNERKRWDEDMKNNSISITPTMIAREAILISVRMNTPLCLLSRHLYCVTFNFAARMLSEGFGVFSRDILVPHMKQMAGVSWDGKPLVFASSANADGVHQALEKYQGIQCLVVERYDLFTDNVMIKLAIVDTDFRPIMAQVTTA
jgi:hypothetical protein